MSYTYLQEQGEESLAECFSDIPLSALSKSKSILGGCYSNGSETGSSHASQSGMMFKPSTGDRGGGKLIFSAADSPARTLVAPEGERESVVPKVVCGDIWRELPMRYDHATSSLKTHLTLFPEDLDKSSAIFPRWGMMSDGVLWERKQPTFHISGNESGLLPTPKASMDGTSPKTLAMVLRGDAEKSLPRVLKMIGLTLQPSFAEWMMGWPIGWTDSLPLGTDKFRQWRQAHFIS